MSNVWLTPRPKSNERMNPSREVLRAMEIENRTFPVNKFVEIPREEWPHRPPPGIVRVFRSRHFMVQVYQENDSVIRLSVHRAEFDRKQGRWKDGISWDDLQHIKTLVGYGDMAAVELYPPLASEVNVANIRHLFILPEPPTFMWRKDRPDAD